MKKIIVPTDFSEGAFNALTHALHYARKLEYAIDVVHAFMLPPTGTAVMVDITDILRKNALEELAKLRKKVEKLELAKDIEINYQAEHGSVVDVVNRAASKSKNAALVIMGTQGASGITEKWLGSNTAAAARNLNTPLLAIPAKLKYRDPESIVFSTDLKKLSDTNGLHMFSTIAHAFGARVKLLHVRKLGEEIHAVVGQPFREQILKAFGKHEVHYSFIFDEKVDEGIKEAIDADRADLLVLVRHEYGFFEGIFHSSVSQNIINEASLPVLVFKG